jgi:hypothetical protein
MTTFENCVDFTADFIAKMFYDEEGELAVLYDDPECVLDAMKEWADEEYDYDPEGFAEIAAAWDQRVNQRKRAIEESGFDGRVVVDIPSLGVHYETTIENLGNEFDRRPVPEPEYTGPTTKLMNLDTSDIGDLLWDEEFNRERVAKGVTWDELVERGMDAVEEFALMLSVPRAVIEAVREYDDPEQIEILQGMGVEL